ncbi:MAG: BrnT family toxin [Candidatus Daviesbacteria bacterium]|nr:BrnT family toxin [Candidatus Daviesbacteria bacterium]
MRVDKIVIEFEWNEGNREKPKKHGLTPEETEEAFFDNNKVVFGDWKHSEAEQRITLLGKTKKGLLLNITYTVRKNKIRVITARPINRKEVPLYEKTA